MKPYISMITLGVDDLHRSIRFYQDGMGLHTEGIIGEEFAQGTVAFFDLQPGLKLALWPRQSLAADAGLPLTATATAMSLAHNVLNETDVDAIMQQASRFVFTYSGKVPEQRHILHCFHPVQPH